MNPALMLLMGVRRKLQGKYVGHVWSGADLDSYTFAAAPLGTPAPDRTIVLVIATSSAQAVAGMTVTVGGAAATLDVVVDDFRMVIARVAVPTGATADIVVSFQGGTKGRCSISIHALTGGVPVLTSGAYAVVATTAPQVTLNPHSGDVVICGGAIYPSSPVTPVGYVERYDQSTVSTEGLAAVQLAGGDTIATSASPLTLGFADARKSAFFAAAAYSPA